MESSIAGLVVLLFSVVLVAVVCLVTTRKAAAGELDRNGSAGIRTRHTQASEEAWRVGHTAALSGVSQLGWIAAATVVLAVAAQVAFGGSWGTFVGLGGMLVEVVVLRVATGAANRAAQAAS